MMPDTMIDLENVTPCAPGSDVVGIFSVDAVPKPENLAPASALPLNVFRANFADNFLGDFGIRHGCSNHLSFTGDHVSDVFLLSPLNKMARINATGIVAGMPSARFWPLSVSQVKCGTVSEDSLPVQHKPSIALGGITAVSAKRPNQTLVRLVRLDRKS